MQYQRAVSVVLYSQTKPVFEWVASDRERLRLGLKHAVLSLAFGLWSIIGIFWAPSAAINNLLGGIDVTAVLTRRPDEPIDPIALAELERQEKRQQLFFVLFLILALVVISYLVGFRPSQLKEVFSS